MFHFNFIIEGSGHFAGNRSRETYPPVFSDQIWQFDVDFRTVRETGSLKIFLSVATSGIPAGRKCGDPRLIHIFAAAKITPFENDSVAENRSNQTLPDIVRPIRLAYNRSVIVMYCRSVDFFKRRCRHRGEVSTPKAALVGKRNMGMTRYSDRIGIVVENARHGGIVMGKNIILFKHCPFEMRVLNMEKRSGCVYFRKRVAQAAQLPLGRRRPQVNRHRRIPAGAEKIKPFHAYDTKGPILFTEYRFPNFRETDLYHRNIIRAFDGDVTFTHIGAAARFAAEYTDIVISRDKYALDRLAVFTEISRENIEPGLGERTQFSYQTMIGDIARDNHSINVTGIEIFKCPTQSPGRCIISDVGVAQNPEHYLRCKG